MPQEKKHIMIFIAILIHYNYYTTFAKDGVIYRTYESATANPSTISIVIRKLVLMQL